MADRYRLKMRTVLSVRGDNHTARPCLKSILFWCNDTGGVYYSHRTRVLGLSMIYLDLETFVDKDGEGNSLRTLLSLFM